MFIQWKRLLHSYYYQSHVKQWFLEVKEIFLLIHLELKRIKLSMVMVEIFYFILFFFIILLLFFFSLLFWYEVSKIMWVMSVWKFSLSLTYLHVHCSPIISIIHDDLLISFNAQHKKIIDRWKWNFMFLWLLR
jgi:hypothetical protein